MSAVLSPSSEVNSPLFRKIYLRTKHAWYILEIPSSHYRPLYANFWVKHSLAHLCVSAALQDEDITYDGFVSLLESGAVSHFLDYDPMEMVGQDLTAQDVNSSSSVRIIFPTAYVTEISSFTCSTSPPSSAPFIRRGPLNLSSRKSLFLKD